MAARKPLDKISTFAALCVTLIQLDGPPTRIRVNGGLQLVNAPLNSESYKVYTMRQAMWRDPWLILYFRLGAKERDLTQWRAADVKPDDLMQCPATLLRDWVAGKTDTREAVSIWRGILQQVQPEFRKWLILMLRGTLAETIGGAIATFKFYNPPVPGAEDKRPQAVKDAAAMGLRLIGRQRNELTETYYNSGVEFISPGGHFGYLYIDPPMSQKPYYMDNKSYSLPEMREMFT